MASSPVAGPVSATACIVLVHNQLPLISNHPRWNELWRAFEDCVNLGIARLLASPSTIRELYRPDAMARFHTYALALARGFARLQMDYNQAGRGRSRASAA